MTISRSTTNNEDGLLRGKKLFLALLILVALEGTLNNGFHSSIFGGVYRGHRIRTIDTSSSSSSSRLAVYTCGWEMSNLSEALFSDAASIQPLTEENYPPNPEMTNILVFGMFGPCPVPSETLNQNRFFTKELYFNGENKDDERLKTDPPDVVNRLGPYPNGNHTHLLYCVVNVAYKFQDLDRLTQPELRPKSSGKRFLLYVQGHKLRYREEAIGQLTGLGTVFYGGKKKLNGTKWVNRNNLALAEIEPAEGPVTRFAEMRKTLRRYRFGFCMENMVQSGYITEKILNVFMGGAIPIYYGTTEVFQVFNREAMVFYDVENPESALQLISHLEANRTAFLEMQSRPILANGEATLREYFSLRDDIGGGELKKKIRNMIGI